MAQTIPFSRNIENDARDSERMALGEVLDDMLEDIHDDVSPKDVRNGRLSAEALEDGQDTRMDMLFRISSKNSGKNGGDWITIATPVTKGVYADASPLPANKSTKPHITHT